MTYFSVNKTDYKVVSTVDHLFHKKDLYIVVLHSIFLEEHKLKF